MVMRSETLHKSGGAKGTMQNAPVLHYFDQNKLVILSVVASQHVMGSALLHDSVLIGFASKGITQLGGKNKRKS